MCGVCRGICDALDAHENLFPYAYRCAYTYMHVCAGVRGICKVFFSIVFYLMASLIEEEAHGIN